LSPEAIAQHLRDAGFVDITDVIDRPTVAHDRAGIDYIAHRDELPPLHIDLKELSYAPTDGETPDILLETALVGKARRPGWATDAAKQTDLFLFVWGDGSALVIPAPAVRAALAKYGSTWARIHRTGRTASRGYYETFYSEYVIVPQSTLQAACTEMAASGAKPASREEISSLVQRIECLRLNLNRSDPWTGDDMSFAQLQAMDEQLTDEILSYGGQRFPSAPIAGFGSAIAPITDYSRLKFESETMAHNAVSYVGDILSQEVFVYAVNCSQRATLVLRRTPGGWKVATLDAAQGTEVYPETLSVDARWFAAYRATATFLAA
jgi:hypothetical protein